MSLVSELLRERGSGTYGELGSSHVGDPVATTLLLVQCPIDASEAIEALDRSEGVAGETEEVDGVGEPNGPRRVWR